MNSPGNLEREWESVRVIDGERYVRVDEANRVADWLNDVMDGWARRGTDAENQLRGALERLAEAERLLSGALEPGMANPVRCFSRGEMADIEMALAVVGGQ